jgi:predicted permease
MTALTQAVRSVLRAPGLGIAAVLCIALGAAATTAVATLISATLWRPLPFPDADRLVRIWFEEPEVNPRIGLSIPDTRDFARISAFEAFAATARVRTTVRLDHGAERMRGEGVSQAYFDLLGLGAVHGRLLSAGDHAVDANRVVVLSHRTWQRHYGGDPAAVGRDFRTERATYTIVGVAPLGFDGTVEDDVVEFFIPIEHYEPVPLRTSRTARPAWVIGRLAPGSSTAAAQTEAETVHRSLVEQNPDLYRRLRVKIEPLGESWRERVRAGGMLLFGAAILLLIVAATNVGCLLLTRMLDRRRELAVRAALGAEPRTIMAQLFVEALLLVSAGGVLGGLAGPWLLDAFLAVAPLDRLSLPRYLKLEPDALTLFASIATLCAAGLVAAVLPALFSTRILPSAVLRDGGRGTLGRSADRRWTGILIAIETALTLVLLVAGGALVRSYARLSTVDLGFDRHRIARLAVTLNPSDVGGPDRLVPMHSRLARELAAVPGVDRVGLVYPTLPPWDGYRSRLRLGGVELPQAPDGLQVGTHLIDEGLLPTLGADILTGRGIEMRDDRASARVAVISQSLAVLFGGSERAIGRTVSLSTRDPGMPAGDFHVIGVAEDIAYDGLVAEETRSFIRGGPSSPHTARYDVYVPLAQFPSLVVSIGVLTSNDPAAIVEPVRKRIASVAPASAVHWTSTMADEIALEYQPTRFYTVLVGLFSSSALALTSVGLFALLAHGAARRSSELGLRLALGASRASAIRLLLRDGFVPLAIGIASGAGLALIVTRAMGSLLYGSGSFDPLSFTLSLVVLVLTALAAAAIPARRVATIDPAGILRSD